MGRKGACHTFMYKLKRDREGERGRQQETMLMHSDFML